jgi:hypothetical protein
MYVIVQGIDAYICTLNTYISRTYVKGKTMYTKRKTTRERVKPRNSDARKNIGCQTIGDKETQENKEKIKEKTLNTPKTEISSVESYILLRGKSLYGYGQTTTYGITPRNQL